MSISTKQCIVTSAFHAVLRDSTLQLRWGPLHRGVGDEGGGPRLIRASGSRPDAEADRTPSQQPGRRAWGDGEDEKNMDEI